MDAFPIDSLGRRDRLRDRRGGAAKSSSSSLATAAFSVAASRIASTCLFPSTPTAPIQLRFLPAALEIKLGFPSPCDIATIDNCYHRPWEPCMKHYRMMIGCLLTASYALGQSVNPFISELKQFYTVRKGDLLKAADRMPTEDYDFRPTPDMRTFGQLIAHIADAQMSFCSGAKGQPRRLNAASKSSKVDLEAALKASFDECDSVLDSTTDATATQVMRAGATEHSKFWSLLYATLHDNEEYGYLAVYLRLRNLVPPSTDSR